MATRNSVENAKSRYTQGGETERFQQRLGWWERDTSLRFADDDVIVNISPKYDRRPDLFASDYFGSSLLQWVVLQFNNIVDINEEFLAGKQIRVPNQQRVLFDFLNKRTGGIPPKTTDIVTQQ